MADFYHDSARNRIEVGTMASLSCLDPGNLLSSIADLRSLVPSAPPSILSPDFDPPRLLPPVEPPS